MSTKVVNRNDPYCLLTCRVILLPIKKKKETYGRERKRVSSPLETPDLIVEIKLSQSPVSI